MKSNNFELENGGPAPDSEQPRHGWGILKNMSGTGQANGVVLTTIEGTQDEAQEKAAGLNETDRVYIGRPGGAPEIHTFFHVAPVHLAEPTGSYEQIVPRPIISEVEAGYGQDAAAA